MEGKKRAMEGKRGKGKKRRGEDMGRGREGREYCGVQRILKIDP